MNQEEAKHHHMEAAHDVVEIQDVHLLPLEEYTEVVVRREGLGKMAGKGVVSARALVKYRTNRAGRVKAAKGPPVIFYVENFPGTRAQAHKVAHRIARQIRAGERPERMPTRPAR